MELTDALSLGDAGRLALVILSRGESGPADANSRSPSLDIRSTECRPLARRRPAASRPICNTTIQTPATKHDTHVSHGVHASIAPNSQPYCILPSFHTTNTSMIIPAITTLRAHSPNGRHDRRFHCLQDPPADRRRRSGLR